MKPDPSLIDALIQAVLEGSKYHAISPDLVRSIGVRELAAQRSFKEAVKATRNKLHQVAGAYFVDLRPDYAAWESDLAGGAAQGELAAACLRVMNHHASTRERLPIVREFFHTILADIPPPHSVLDVACGLNPLAIHWMPLAPGATYAACDIYADLAGFLNRFFALGSIAGEAFVCDLASGPPTNHVDLALVLKVLPPLEQIRRGAAIDLLNGLNATYMIVSFPTRSLGGRGKGMADTYERQFQAMIASQPWQVRKFMFPGELVFLVQKN